MHNFKHNWIFKMLDSLWYNVVPIERILMYFVLHMLTVDCG